MTGTTTAQPKSEMAKLGLDDWYTRHNDVKYRSLVGQRMGMVNYTDRRKLQVGDHVTSQHGGASDYVGQVEELLDGDKVRVQWLSNHIGPSASTVAPRGYLIALPAWTDRAPAGPPETNHNRSTAFVLRAVEKGWHVSGRDATAPTAMSPGYDGETTAYRKGEKVSVRYDHTGRITWARIIAGRSGNTGDAYAVVCNSAHAGHTAMMWLL